MKTQTNAYCTGQNRLVLLRGNEGNNTRTQSLVHNIVMNQRYSDQSPLHVFAFIVIYLFVCACFAHRRTSRASG